MMSSFHMFPMLSTEVWIQIGTFSIVLGHFPCITSLSSHDGVEDLGSNERHLLPSQNPKFFDDRVRETPKILRVYQESKKPWLGRHSLRFRFSHSLGRLGHDRSGPVDSAIKGVFYNNSKDLVFLGDYERLYWNCVSAGFFWGFACGQVSLEFLFRRNLLWLAYISLISCSIPTSGFPYCHKCTSCCFCGGGS